MSDSSDDRRRDGMSPDDGADPFAPATVDEAIEAVRRSSPTTQDDRDAALVRALIQIHALPPGATATLERVRNQLQSTALANDDDPPIPGDLPQVMRTLPPWRPFRARFGGWQTSFVREVAAVLVVALLGASFFCRAPPWWHERPRRSAHAWRRTSERSHWRLAGCLHLAGVYRW